MNRIILIGRIASNLELKVTQGGTSVCTFRLAVDRNYQKKGEEKVADFFNITCWRATAEFVTKWFNKGNLILVEGEMQTRQYTDKNGFQQTWYEVVADNIHFTGEKTGSANQEAANAPTAAAPVPSPTANTAGTATVAQDINDDYPF